MHVSKYTMNLTLTIRIHALLVGVTVGSVMVALVRVVFGKCALSLCHSYCIWTAPNPSVLSLHYDLVTMYPQVLCISRTALSSRTFPATCWVWLWYHCWWYRSWPSPVRARQLSHRSCPKVSQPVWAVWLLCLPSRGSWEVRMNNIEDGKKRIPLHFAFNIFVPCIYRWRVGLLSLSAQLRPDSSWWSVLW